MAQLPDLSSIPSCLCVVGDDAITSIKNEIINVLRLENKKNNDQIIHDLLENGRQSLANYQVDILPELYAIVMYINSNKLIELLKKYFQHLWETQYGSLDEWFILFLQQYQHAEKHYLYERVLTRTAEYGNKYMKDCPVLSIVLQLLFDGIDDQCLKETNTFNDLWFTITNDGLKSIKKYSDYITEDVMNEQLNKSQSTLFRALRKYYWQDLFQALQQSNIRDEENLYALALDSVVEHGWLLGVQEIREQIPLLLYIRLLQNVRIFLQQKMTSDSDMQSESIFSDKHEQQECIERITVSSDLPNTIKVRFCPTNILYQVHISEATTVKDLIADVCRQANKHIRDDCYLWFNSREININDTIIQAGLNRASNLTKDLPEVRLKYIQVLRTAIHIGKKICLASAEHLAYHELLDISLPSTKNYITPNIVKKIAEQIIQHASSISQSVHQNGTVFIPLPNFSEQSIDSLPSIYLRVPLSPNQFDWNVFLECLANDLEIERTDFIVVSAQEGSTIFKIKLRPKLARVMGKIKKVENKVLIMVLPKCEQFVAEHTTSKANKIQVELKNFAERENTDDRCSLSLDEIDLALRLCERPAIINDDSWKFMIEKSRRISTCIIQSIQSCSDEYVIDHASIVYNEQIYDKYENFETIDKNEKILFHGTSTVNFDGIFEQNFQYNSGVKRTDAGWYGQGIYFSSSPKKALCYAKSDSKVSYLICSLVRLGKTLTITDMRYKGKPMHPNYDSHYIPIKADGDPIAKGEIPTFEEFVIKRSDQVMPLYIIGMVKVSCFVIWRDAKITNEANSALFEVMKHQYAFNIYGSQTSIEALDILKFKLINNESMKCVVVTNGADDGEGFVRQCRVIRSSLPIIVYCKNKTYHQQWAATLPRPKINISSSPEEVFNFITKTLQK